METNLLDIVKEFEGTIKPGELRDILGSLKAIQEGGGYGVLKIEMRSDRVGDLSIKITRKDEAAPIFNGFRLPVLSSLRRGFIERQRANWRKFEAIRR